MKFHYSLLFFLLLAGVQSKSLLPDGFQIDGLEGIDLNALLNDDDDQARQLSAITDRLKTLFQGTLTYLQSLRKIPQYIADNFRRPLGSAAAGAAAASSGASNLLPAASSNLVDSMATSGSEVVPSVVDTNGNSISNFIRRAMRAAWGKRVEAAPSSHQKEVLKGVARIVKTLTNSKMILGQLHRLTARSGLKRVSQPAVSGSQPVILAGVNPAAVAAAVQSAGVSGSVGPLVNAPVPPAGYPVNGNLYQY